MSYPMKSFEQDLKQLGGMIEHFYSQKGGKKSDNENVTKRRFKILDVNGKKYPYSSSYKGTTPGQAASHVGNYVCNKHLNIMDKSKCTFEFNLVETTRGSSKKVYGPYVVSYEKLAKPRNLKFPKAKRTLTVTHKKNVKKSKNL